jgi:hypothetical protein
VEQRGTIENHDCPIHLHWQWIWGGKSWFTILPASSILQAIVLLLGFGIVLVME